MQFYKSNDKKLVFSDSQLIRFKLSLIVFAVHMLAQILGLLVNKFMCVRDVHEE